MPLFMVTVVGRWTGDVEVDLAGGLRPLRDRRSADVDRACDLPEHPVGGLVRRATALNWEMAGVTPPRMARTVAVASRAPGDRIPATHRTSAGSSTRQLNMT